MIRHIADQVLRLVNPHLQPLQAPENCLPGVAFGPAGSRRHYLFQPPRARSTPHGLPLLVLLHGCGQNAREFAQITRMNALAARERFLVLYIEQDRLANPKGCWNWYERNSGVADAEAATLMAAIERVCLRHPVDRDRIAVAGLSAGASMAALLATRYPRRFAAVAMHSGVTPGAALSPLGALGAMRGEQGVPMVLTAVGKAIGAAAQLGTLPPLLVLHGDEDEVVVPSNADATAAVWAMAVGAQAGAERTQHQRQRHAFRTTDFTAGGRTVVSLCRVAGLGHSWSGGAPGLRFSDPKGPDASRLIWAFAREQFGQAGKDEAQPQAA